MAEGREGWGLVRLRVVVWGRRWFPESCRGIVGVGEGMPRTACGPTLCEVPVLQAPPTSLSAPTPSPRQNANAGVFLAERLERYPFGLLPLGSPHPQQDAYH